MAEITPIVFNLFMKPFEKKALQKRRSEIIPKAQGNVLEIGAGTGVNFNYYKKENLNKLTVLDLKFNNIIKNHSFNKEIDIDYVEGSGENLPFDDNSFDSVVSTLIYCSIDNPDKALKEVFRVLKPGGRMFFIEHVLPEEDPYRNVVNSFNDTWKRIGKCNVNRETHRLIEKAGFKIEDFERFGKGCFVFIKGVGIKE